MTNDMTAAPPEWIEPTFREWESGGFGLDTSGLLPGDQLERLLIPLLLVYL